MKRLYKTDKAKVVRNFGRLFFYLKKYELCN